VSQDRQSTPPADETERRRLWIRAVLAGSVAPRSAEWLFRTKARMAEQPVRARAITYALMALSFALAAVCIAAVATGHGKLAGYLLLAVFGVGGVLSVVGLVIDVRRVRKRR
jgi:hypothetical protein